MGAMSGFISSPNGLASGYVPKISIPAWMTTPPPARIKTAPAAAPAATPAAAVNVSSTAKAAAGAAPDVLEDIRRQMATERADPFRRTPSLPSWTNLTGSGRAAPLPDDPREIDAGMGAPLAGRAMPSTDLARQALTEASRTPDLLGEIRGSSYLSGTQRLVASLATPTSSSELLSLLR